MQQLSKTIFSFNKGDNKKIQIEKARRICEKYLNLGAEVVVLGCTEFAVMLNNEQFPKINTIDILVKATISKFLFG